MTRLTKIPVIAAFSAVIAAFTVTTEASADRGDGRHYSQNNGHRGGDGYRGGHSYHGGDYNRSSNRAYSGGREYRGNRDYGATRNAYSDYRGGRDYSPNRSAYAGNREYRGNGGYHNGNHNYRSDTWGSNDRRWSGNRYRDDNWRGRDNWHGDRRWSDNRYRGNNWHGDRRYYGGYHGRPYYGDNHYANSRYNHYANSRYDYHRSWRDRDYYWHNRHHWSSWRPYYGPIWGGYRHAYWRDRGCIPVTRYWTWDGRPALVGGIQCYNPYGVAYIVDDDYYPLNYY